MREESLRAGNDPQSPTDSFARHAFSLPDTVTHPRRDRHKKWQDPILGPALDHSVAYLEPETWNPKPWLLSFRKLESLSRTRLTVLFSFSHTLIAGKQAGLLEGVA
jgi:hypothetical protein